MERQQVYCEIEFYRQFINAFPKEVIPTEEGIQKSKRWVDFNSYLFKSDLILNINGLDFKTLTENSEYFWLLWKRSTSGECGLEFDERNFPNLEKFSEYISLDNKYLSSVYLTCNHSEFCQNIEANYGVKVIPNELVFKTDNFFNVHIESIEKGEKSHKNWDFLRVYKHPCNALAIVDNYILKNEMIINENIVPILDKLLPKKLEIPFHISIFAKNEFNNKKHQEHILNLISAIRPELNFKFTMHKMQNEFHDRSIITNYMLIDSGSGFDLFSKNRANHQTRITGYYPFSAANINADARLTYQGIKKSLRKIFDTACDTKYLTTFWGDKENRLFEN